MTNYCTLRIAAALACGLMTLSATQAKTGAPHSLKADCNFTDVTLSWCAPADSKELYWHSNRDYNGDASEASDTQKALKSYAATKFTATDLKNYVGENVEAIKIFQYRPVVATTVMVYEDEEVVASKVADPSLYEKNTWLSVKFDTPVEIKEGKEYMFAVCFEHGSNVDFVAIKDEASNYPGKGDLFSTDGKTWVSTAAGEYLITAVLANDADEAATGYNVYRNNERINSEPLSETSIELKEQPVGNAVYTVSAIYADAELMSKPAEVKLQSYADMLPSPTILSSKVDELSVNLEWAQPLLGGKELTWSNKTLGAAIGGTASSNTKVWIRNNFDATDLVAFRGGKITAINQHFKEAVVTGVTLFVLKNGKVDYYQVIPEEKIAEIKAGEWIKFTLDTPYQLEDGNSYGYGIYVLHTPKMHPMSCDTSSAIDVKGNSFSTSSPNSSDFLKSNPSWKTLKSGGIAGNWMMTADVEGAPAAIEAPAYDVYRDGTLLKSAVTGLSIDDNVEDLGKYTYSVVSRQGDKSSVAADCQVNVKLPAAYSAPIIENTNFDTQTKDLEITWNMDKEISHCGTATYMVGFDEDMDIMWGTQFTAAELSAYKGYTISKLKFCIGEEVGDITIGVYGAKGVKKSVVEIPAGSLTSAAEYTVKLPEPVAITGEEDLYFAYSANVAGGLSPIILDGGPAVEGGAKISLTNGLSWLNLSTLNPSYAAYNIYISAMASENVGTENAPAKIVEIGNVNPTMRMNVKADKVYGVEAVETAASPCKTAPAKAAAAKVKAFNIYCNGKKVAETTDFAYIENIKRFASFNYHVTTVYTNGWESAPSTPIEFTNRVAQKGVAPYGLTASVSGNDLKLEWQEPAKSTVLTYMPESYKQMGLRMTGSSPTSYCGMKVAAKDLTENVGDVISHIQFGASALEINSCAVFVMFGENIVYTQSVPVSSLIVGMNDVRLNEPVVIPANTDVATGFIMSYGSTGHPLGCFESSDNTNLADLISSSASPGYWYSLHTKFKSEYNWCIKAILAKADSSLAKAPSRAEAQTSYNVYCDGMKIDSTTDKQYTVKDAVSGRYYVTAANGDEESSESNAVEFKAGSGVDTVGTESTTIFYDKASQMVISGGKAAISIYAANGMEVASVNGYSISVADLAPGVYTVVAKGGKETKTMKFQK